MNATPRTTDSFLASAVTPPEPVRASPSRDASCAPRRTWRLALVAPLTFAVAAVVACGTDEPTAPTQLPPDATQPVNSMTQDSAMVPGGELDPQPDPETP